MITPEEGLEKLEEIFSVIPTVPYRDPTIKLNFCDLAIRSIIRGARKQYQLKHKKVIRTFYPDAPHPFKLDEEYSERVWWTVRAQTPLLVDFVEKDVEFWLKYETHTAMLKAIEDNSDEDLEWHLGSEKRLKDENKADREDRHAYFKEMAKRRANKEEIKDVKRKIAARRQST